MNLQANRYSINVRYVTKHSKPNPTVVTINIALMIAKNHIRVPFVTEGFLRKHISLTIILCTQVVCLDCIHAFESFTLIRLPN